ncbi:MAG: GyrI-like domain-containing protein [Clostridiaceae bacterium]|nr:GyrI-like domain-containing protein [Clostridiaceae bacterium]
MSGIAKLKGGNVMDYKIVEKDAFTVIGSPRMFKYETAQAEIPGFWTEHFQSDASKHICGMYGVCVDEKAGAEEFEYLIADNYQPQSDVPEGLVTRVIPKHTWAVFPCKGPMPNAIQNVNNMIFSEWLPNCKDYEIAAGYNIEMYGDPSGLPQGTQDINYYSEIWIPVKKK